MSYDGKSESLIDYITLPIERTDGISKCEILDDSCLNVSRHRPIVCSVNIPILSEFENDLSLTNLRINWKKLSPTDIQNYQSFLDSSYELKIASHTLNCKNDIDNLYESLVNNIKSASDKCFPRSKYREHLKPYWNDNLTNAHKEMKYRRNIWLNDGRPRNKDISSYQYYKTAKHNFRKLHRHYVNIYLSKLDMEIDKTAELDKEQFWKIVNNRRKRSNTRAGSEIKFNGTIYNNV